ncbi:MAG: hypothetical protein OEM17_02245 [Nitrosopumilus sp.]|nr:hypothetical protein [Nitrosopumilus sp.]
MRYFLRFKLDWEHNVYLDSCTDEMKWSYFLSCKDVGSGYVSAKNMARFGIPLNLISILLVSVLVAVLVPLI